MPEHADGTMIAVEPHVVEGLAIQRPHHRIRDVGYGVVEVRTGFEVADARGVEFGAGVVGGPSEPTMIGLMARRAEMEVRLRLGDRIAIEQQFFAAPLARLAADERVLAAVSIP